MEEYKESGIDWIGKIPKNWDIQPLGVCFDERREKVSDTLFEPLSVTKKGILKQLDNVAKSDAHDDRKKVCKDDFVINSRSDRKQSCGLSDYDGSVSLINTVLISNKKMLEPIFVKYLLDNCMFAEEFYRNGHGIVADLWTTNYTEMKRIYIPIPSKREQKKIASVLFNKVSKIDKILENLNKQVEILNNFKKSIITEAVTKGIYKNRKYKSTGIEWIQNIPEDWSIKRIINISYLKGRIGWQGLTTDEYIEEGPFLVTGIDFYNGNIDWKNCVHVSEWRFEQAPEIQLKENDLLITKDGTVGKVAITQNTPAKVTLNSGVLLIRPIENNLYENRFLYYVLLSDEFWKWFDYINSGNTTIIHLYQNVFAKFKFALPSIIEQKEIINYLDEKCSNIDKTIKIKQKQIDKLENYKKSLIYEYVTGKKRVKEE